MSAISKLVIWDIRNGVLRAWPKLIGIAALFVFLSLTFSYRFEALEGDVSCLGFESYLLNIFAGIERYSYDPSEPFRLPAQWLFTLLCIAYFTLHYPSRDLSGMGVQLMLASGSRRHWWFSKCVWIAASVISVFLIGITICFISACLSGGFQENLINVAALRAMNFNVDTLTSPPWNVAIVVITAVAMTLSICYVQFAIAVTTKPLIGFVVTVSILFVSAFVQDPCLVGNYLMAARSEVFTSGGMIGSVGIVFSILLSSAAIGFGYLYFRNMDILG